MQEINKKILVLWVGVLGLLSQVSGQMPNWSPPQAGDFQYSSTALTQVFFEDVLQTHPGDRLAVFAGGQIRGLSSHVNGFHFLTVYSNVPQENMQLFYYSEERDSVYLALTPFTFVVGSHQGSFEEPFAVQVYEGNDAPIDLLPLPDALGLQSFPLAPIDLAPYLISLDGDPVVWSVLPHGQIQAQINGSQLQLIPSADFTGMAVLTLVATEVTDNAFQASTELLVTILPIYPGPGLVVVPGQGTVQGTSFVNLCDEESSILLQLSDFEETAVGCVNYDYLPVVQVEDPATPRPDWQVTQTYPNNFSLVASVVYTPNFPLTGADNLLMASVNGEIRAVSPPILQSGEIRYYLNVGGGPGDGEVLLHFYSQERGLIYQWKDTLPYLAGSQIGSLQYPLLVDVSPLLPLVDELGQVEMVIQYPEWIGEQSFTYYAYDCAFPEFLNSSSVASYCVVTSEQALTYYYRDRDGDGYGDVQVFTRNCSPPQGFIDRGLDCRDDDSQISPAGPFYCIQDVDLYLDITGSATLLPEMTDTIRPYLCGTDSLKLSQSLFGCEDLGSQLVQYSVFDLNGNFDFSLFLVSVLDTLAPQYTCPDPIVLSSCQQEIPDLVAMIVDISDNCGSWQITQQPLPGTLISSFSGNAVEVQISVVDESGQETLCFVPVSVQDTQAPQFMNCPQDQNFIVGLLEGNCQGVGLWSIPIAQDDCGWVEVQQTQGPRPDSLLSVGIYLIEYTAQDSAGNASTCSFTLEVIDTADPIIVCPGNLFQFETDPGQCTWTSPPGSLTPLLVWSPCEAQYSWEVTGATQGSGQGDLSGLVFELGSSQVQYTLVETASGQSWSCSFTVEVWDREAPVIPSAFCNTSYAVNVDAGVCTSEQTFDLSATTDNCTSPVSYSAVIMNPNGTFTSYSTAAFTHEYAIGISEVRVTVTDAGGNVSSCTYTVIVSDTQLPVIECPTLAVSYGNTMGVCGYVVNGTEFDATGTDNCGVVSLVHNYGAWGNVSSLAGATFPVGSTEVIWTARDAAGNVSSCTITIVVNDTEAPVFVNCPSGLTFTIGSDGDCENGVIWSIPIAQDNCGAAVTQTGGPALGSSLVPGMYAIEYTAMDAAGNTATCTFEIHVVDDSDPLLVCPPSFAIGTDGGMCSWTSAAGDLNPLLAVDNCPGQTLSYAITGATTGSGTGNVPATAFHLGVSTITYTLTDGVNTVNCSFSVTVVDEEAPVIPSAFCNTSYAVNVDAGVCTSEQTFDLSATTDNCTLPLGYSAVIMNPNGTFTSYSTAAFTHEYAIGISEVRVTVTDAAGNVSSCTYTVIVSDTQLPVIECPTLAVSYGNTMGVCGYVVNGTEFDATGTDNCGVVSLVHNYGAWGNVSSLAGATFPVGSTEVIWTARDAAGNVSSCAITIVVNDTEAPVFVICPQDLTFAVGLFSGDCETGAMWPVPLATDNCGVEVEQTGGPAQDSILRVGMYAIEYTATDAAGNTATCTFYLEVIDTEDPVIVCPGNVVVNSTNAGVCTWTSPEGSLRPLLANSNCDYEITWIVTNPDMTLVSGTEDVSGYTFAEGLSEVTYTIAETASGQSWSCSFTVEVWDREAPVMTCPEPLVLECGEEENAALLEDWLASVRAEDNCTAEPTLEVELYQVDTRCGNTALHTYRFKALDAQGNAQFCFATVTYVDTKPPQIVQPAQDRIVQCDGTGNDWELLEWLNQNGGAQAAEGCSDSLQWNYVLGPWQSECGGTGFVTVTFFVRDDCNHYSSTQARFIRIDTLAPQWQILPQPLLLECDDTGLFEGQLEAWLSTAGGGLALDACSGVTYTHDYTGLSGGCSGGIGQTTVTFRVTDACGNSRSHAVLLEVQDRQAPEWVLPTRDTLVECDGQGNLQALQDWIDHRAGALAYDACSGVADYEQEWLYTLEGCGNTQRHRYRFTALDACGNRSASVEAEFAIVDRTPPAFVRAPSNQIVECDGQGNTQALESWLQEQAGALALDVCSGEDLVWTYHLVNTTDLCGLTGTKVFQFIVTDACGNQSSAQANFTIVDQEAPVITGGEDVLWEECEPSPAGNFPSFQFWLENRAGATATDVCGSFIWSHDYHPDHWITVCGNARYVDVTFRAEDVCGNASEITRRFSIGDSEKPRFLNCPSLPLVVSAPQGWCQTFVNFTPPQASDNCGEVTIRQIDTTGLNSGSLFPLGLTLLIFEAEDLCGNKDTCYYPIVVNDYALILGQCPEDSQWDNDPGKCGAVVQSVGLRNWETACPQGTAILYRIEDTQGQITGGGIDNLSGRFLPTGLHRITYEIWNQPRLLITSVLNTPEAVFLEITSFGPAALDLTWLTLESEGAEPFSITLPPGIVLQSGQSYVQAFPPQTGPTAYVVKFFNRVIDALALGPYTGNSFPWTGVLEADHYFRKDLFNHFGQSDWLAADLCNAPEIGHLNPLLEGYVYDGNGAVVTLQTVQIPPRECSFEILIEDTEAPVCAQLETRIYPGSTGPIGEGQCSSYPVSVTEDILVSRLHLSNLKGLFPQMMELTAHLVSPSGTRVLLFDNLCNTTADFDLNLSDRAPQTLASVLCGPMGQGGTYQPLESFKAFAGESSQGEWRLELQTQLPLEGVLLSWNLALEELSPYDQSDVILANELGLCGASFEWTHVYFADNCCEGSLRVDYQRTDGGPKPQGGLLALGGGGPASEFFAVGTTTVIYTLEDAQGNVSTCSFEVKVEDTEAPILAPGSCPSAQIVLGPTQCSTLYPYPTLEVTDNCGIASIVYDPAPGYFFPIGTTPVSVVAEDLSGNTVTCEFTVTVLEYIPPVTTLFCNDLVRLSLGPDCRAEIGADVLLEGSNYRCFDNYCITLRDAMGQIIGSSQEGTNFVDISHVGTTVEATLCSCQDPIVNCCTVAIEVEALSLPQVQCPEDVTIACNGSLHPDALGRPVLTNCVPSATINYYDTFENGGVCGEPRAVLLRRWVIQNDRGDKVECEQRITILSFDNNKIVFPEDKLLDCAEVALQPSLTHPDFAGLPRIGDQALFGAHLCEFFAGYTDVVLQDANCSGGYQILRTWIIRNECLPIIPGVNPVTHTQTLHVDDRVGPEFLREFDDVTISTEAASCRGSLSLGKVSDFVMDFCSEVAEVTAVASGCQIVRKASGELVIEKMRKGKHQVKVIARDDCWNYSERNFEVTVEDRTPPVAVCKSQVTVALSTEGYGRLSALSLDNGSYDNCGALRYEVERPVGACGGSVKGEYVDFCCEDLGPEPVKVMLRVWDDADGDGIFGSAGDYYNECEVEVTLQTLIPPVVLCPQDLSLQCYEDPFDLALTGAPVLLEGCEGLDFEYTDQIDLHACGHGTIIRNWTLPGFASVGCTQILVLQAPRPLDPEVDIRWPLDVTVDCAGVGSLPGPEWEDVLCSSIGVSFKDQLYFSVPNYCYRVERTWTLIDACVYEPNNPSSPGVYTHQQWISVIDQGAPALASCDTLVLGWVEGSCALGNVEVRQSAVNFDCGIGTPLVWRYRLDLEANGSFDLEGEALGEEVSVVLPSVPLGEHVLEWQVTDACGNVSTCLQTLVVKDVEAPALICRDEIVVVPMQNGTVEVQAALFVLQASDNCTPAQDLLYSFAPQAWVPVLTFGCEDIPNGQSQLVDLSVYVSDASGNATFCQVRLLLQDNQDVCPDQDDLILGFALSGLVKNRRGEAIRYVETRLVSDFPHFPKVDSTLAAGEYGFVGLPQPGRYELHLSRETDFRQGVSTLDFALLQRHLLGLQPFDSPFQHLASDLNADQKVGGEDLLLLRDVVLARRVGLPGIPSWGFVPQSHVFQAPWQPWPLPAKVEVWSLQPAPREMHFTGWKMGDVNGNASGQSVEGRSPVTARFLLEDLWLEAGEEIPVAWRGRDMEGLMGCQFTLQTRGVSLVAMVPGALSLNAEGVHVYSEDKITASWASLQPMTFSDQQTLFTTVLKAEVSGWLSEKLGWALAPTAPEAYLGEDLRVAGLRLDFAPREGKARYALHQNEPNPFRQETKIYFELPSAQAYRMAIFTPSGQEVFSQEGAGNAGWNELRVDQRNLGAQGVLYYKIQSGGFTATRKMIRIE